MGYPVYKLLRAVNRQYPNNGFINAVDVREDLYGDVEDEIIDEDLRDLINETLQEVYIHVAVDEVYSFPTVAGQKEYSLPEDCDLRDIQEVTRTFRGYRVPPPPPGPPPIKPTFELTFYANGGTGEMEPMEAEIGEKLILPECTFTPPDGLTFKCWDINGRECQPGDEVAMYANLTVMPIWWVGEEYTITMYISTFGGTGILHYQRPGEVEHTLTMTYSGEPFVFKVVAGSSIGSVFTVLELHDEDDNRLASYTSFTPEHDTQIPMAVPVVTPPDAPRPADNGDGGYGDNPIGGDNNDIAEPVVDADTEEPIGG